MLFRFHYSQLGDRIHTRMFAGPAEGALELCGLLVMRNSEFEQFKQLLEAGLFTIGEASDNKAEFIEKIQLNNI